MYNHKMNQLCSLLLIFVITAAKHSEANSLPWCQLGDKHQPVAPYVKYLGNELSIFCPFSHCPDAQCTIAHYSNHSSQYDEISRGPCRATIHISSYGDGGVYKCGCANNTANMTQCIHVVDVLPTKIEKDFPTIATVGDSYSGMCRARGNPRPNLNLEVLSGVCSHSIYYTSPDPYTTQALITIHNVMSKCRTIYCATSSNYNPLLEPISLNITVRNITHDHPELDETLEDRPTNTTGGSAAIPMLSVNIVLWLFSMALVLT